MCVCALKISRVGLSRPVSQRTWIETQKSGSIHRETYLNKVQQLIQVLHLIPLCFTVVSAGVQARALDGASIQGQIHGFSIQLYGLVTHCLVHVAIQLICGIEEKLLR